MHFGAHSVTRFLNDLSDIEEVLHELEFDLLYLGQVQQIVDEVNDHA